MHRRKARLVRWFVPVVFLLGMMACGLPSAIEPGGEPAVDEPAQAVSGAESGPLTPETEAAGEEVSGPPPTQAPEAVAEPPPAESVESVSVVPVNVNTAFILDASGSMLAGLGDKSRLLVAQDAITKLSAGLPTGINASLWVYGHRVEQDDKAASCLDIEQVIPLGPVDPARFDSVAHSYGAKGYTPISESIRQAAASLPKGESERNTIVLVSDGEETCDADPCALAAELANIDEVVIHTIGLDVEEVARAQLQCIADATGGTYRDADDAEGLELALEEAADAAAVAGGIVTGLGRASSVAISPDGAHAYVTGAEWGTLLAFSRDPGSGALTLIDVQKDGEGGVDGLNGAFSAAVSPDGKNVYVAGSRDDAVAVFSRDPGSGTLAFVQMVKDEGLDETISVAVSPDNRSVYAIGAEGDALLAFSRDPGTGSLALIGTYRHGEGGVEGLDRVQSVTVSPDSQYVYTVSNPSAKDDALVVFNRDPGSGALTFVKAYQDGVDGLDGLQGGSSVFASLDNQHVYVAARIDDAVTAFRRDPNGDLTLVGSLRNRDSGFEGISGARAVTVSPDGAHVYVVGDKEGTLAAFGRDASTGALTFLEMHRDNVDGVDGLELAIWVTLSPDGRNVYVAGFDDDAVAVFRRDAATGRLAFVQGITNAE